MYELLETYPDEPILLSPYEDGISNRQRRSLRVQSAGKRRQDARQAQSDAGVRIRLWRKVLNEEAFAPELKVWHQPQQDGTARRKNYRQFTMTVFDTAQQPLRNMEFTTQEEVDEELRRRCPELFEALGPLATAGVAKLGSKQAPFLALTFADPRVERQRVAARNVVAPELILDDSHQLLHQSHVSLGKITVPNMVDCDRIAEEIREQLVPVRPTHVRFGPLQAEVTQVDGLR